MRKMKAKNTDGAKRPKHTKMQGIKSRLCLCVGERDSPLLRWIPSGIISSREIPQYLLQTEQMKNKMVC